MTKTNDTLVSIGAVLGLIVLSFALVYGKPSSPVPTTSAAVVPEAGVELPVVWDDLRVKLIGVGAIDEKKWRELYASRGGLPAEEEKLITGESGEKLRITRENANYLLNLLWALGLANKNQILEDEMMDPRYGGAGNFASTGGWTLARGDAMEHYNKYALVTLTQEQQALVDRVSRNIYRPCCGNSTHFPDCNHGMAMLAFLELAAAQGVGEEDVYQAALALNAYWFPQTYLTIAAYKASQGVAWENISPKEVLGYDYSSAAGYTNIASQVTAPQSELSGGGCSA